MLDILTAGVFATAIPTLLGILIAYSLIATILGSLLWAAKSIADDVAIAILSSGIIIGLLILGGVVFIRHIFS